MNPVKVPPPLKKYIAVNRTLKEKTLPLLYRERKQHHSLEQRSNNNCEYGQTGDAPRLDWGHPPFKSVFSVALVLASAPPFALPPLVSPLVSAPVPPFPELPVFPVLPLPSRASLVASRCSPRWNMPRIDPSLPNTRIFVVERHHLSLTIG